MKLKFSSMGLTALCLLSGSACSSTTQPTAADYDDVAQGLSSVTATSASGGEVVSITDSVSLSIGTATPGISLKAAGEFAGSRLGLSYDYAITCNDAAGAKMTACDRTTADAAVNVNWSGDLTLPNLSAKVQREGDWKLTNIQSGTVVVAGKGEFDFDATFQSLFRNVERSYHVGYSADYSNVQVRLAPGAIVGGSIKYVIDAQRKASTPRHESQANFHMDGLLEFGSDGHATLTLDGEFRYALDTTTGMVTKMASVSKP
jgi:hypothetical protein